MRTLRLLMAFAAVGSMVAAAGTGCTSSDNNGGGGGETDAGTIPGLDGSSTLPDGGGIGTDGGNPGDSATLPTITPAASDLKVYLGQIAQLDASATTVSPASVTPTYKWTVESAPAGSAITTPSLFNAGSAKPSFTPDVLGDYTLKVTVSAGGATADKTVKVSAFEAQALYLYTEGDGGKYGTFGVRAAATVSDAGAHDLSCHTWDAGPYDNSMYQGQLWASTIWEGPAGSDSKVAYVQQLVRDDAGQAYQLNVVTTSSSCAAPPVKLDELAPTNAGTLADPVFSPNGQRVAYLRKPTNGPDHVLTVGADGTAPHNVGLFAVQPDGGPADASVPWAQGKVMAPQWLDDTKVGWMQLTGGTNWQIALSDDTDGAMQSVYMTCASLAGGDLPTQFAFTKDGSVIVPQRTAFNDSGSLLGGGDLLVYKPNATTKKCELVRNLTNFETDGGATFPSAHSFSLSPDGTQVAYVTYDTTIDAGGSTAYSVWTVTLDGLTPPARVPGAPARGVAVAFGTPLGPHWAAGGSMLVWPQEQRTVDAGNTASEAIVVASAGGGPLRVVDNSNAAHNNVYGIGQGTSCAIATASGSGVVGLGALGAFLGLLVRRRRNKKN